MKLSLGIIASLLFLSVNAQSVEVFELNNTSSKTLSVWRGYRWVINVVKVSGTIKGSMTFEIRSGKGKEKVVQKYLLSDVYKQQFIPTFLFDYVTFSMEGKGRIKVGLIYTYR